MKFMMFVVVDPSLEADSNHEDMSIDEWFEQAQKTSTYHTGDALRHPREAKTVTLKQGRVHVTDGPFSEAKEWIAGFDIFECDTWEQAIEIAAAHPQSNGGRLELREFWDMEADGPNCTAGTETAEG